VLINTCPIISPWAGLYTELTFGGGAYIRNGLSVGEYGGFTQGAYILGWLYSEVYGVLFFI
jgi:hypothetical protein